MTTARFKDLFCRRYGCEVEHFERRAFRRLLYGHAKLIAPVLRLIHPRMFAEDFKFISYLGDSEGFRDASVDVLNFNDVNRGNPGLVRGTLRIRVSGRKATRMAKQLFGVRRMEHSGRGNTPVEPA